MNRVVNNVKPTRRRQRRYKQYQMVDICNCGCNFVHSKMYLCICICDEAEILVRPWLRVYWEAAGWWESLQLLNISIADKEVYLCALYFSLKFYGICFMVFAWEKKTNIAKGTTDPGVDCFDQWGWFGRFGLVGLVWWVWFGRFGLVCLVCWGGFGRLIWVGLVW